MDRRHFLQATSSAALIAVSSRLAAQTIKHNPFTLGVASGTPSLDGFVLWTRLMAAPGGEPLPDAPIEIGWELASDAGFKAIVQNGKTVAQAQFAHSVHLEIKGLPAGDARYWYRFRVADAVSPVGRTRALPARDAAAPALRLALASCQHFERGYFGAHRHMAQESLDMVLFVGDYIYEYGIGQDRARKHTGGTCLTLDDYRNRYALYKSDADLQASHASCPWMVTWDDHEVENDYAKDRAPSMRDVEFLARRAAAYRAYWEHMPLRMAQLPMGPDARIYRRYRWGRAATLHVLDARQYRDYQVCTPSDQGGSRTININRCAELNDPKWSLLGATQEKWLADGMRASEATFNLVGQQSLMSQMRQTPARAQKPEPADWVWNDSWDGYPAARARALENWASKKNVVSLGGDVHAFYTGDLRTNFDDEKSPVVATEFIGGSVTSPSWPQGRTEQVMTYNPHIKYGKSDQRGYTLLDIKGAQLTAQVRLLDDVARIDASVSTHSTWVVEAGKPGAQRA
jgi:alkaline phosphatase D